MSSIADRYKDMVAEIQQLKAKNAELQEANDTFTLGAKRAIESNCKLYQENIKLEEALVRATLESEIKDASMNVVKWANDFRDLTEENIKLEEALLRATLESGRKDKLYFKDTGKLRDENWKQIDEIKKLKDFTNWENHPALKHKVVLDDDYYLEHLSDGELIHPDEIKKLKGNLTHQADFWACLMDCRDNPDNPTQQEIDEWCEAYNKSDEVRLSIYESAGIDD